MNCTAEMLRLYAVTDRAWVGKLTLPQQVEAALKGGATCVQLREKNLADSSVLAEAREISALCKQYRVPFILNDNVALAAQCGADGVHLGQEDMDPAQARRILGPDAIIGVSAHNVAEAKAAVAAGADYLGCGAMFATTTKTNVTALPKETLREAIGELLLSGVTTVLDMYYFEEVVAKVMDEMGIRGIAGETVMEKDSCDSKNADEAIERGIALIEAYKDHPRVSGAITPHGTTTCSPETLKRAYEEDVKAGTVFTLHVAEMDYEMTQLREQYNMTPIEFMEHIGVLGSNTLAAHSIRTTEHDVEILAKHGASVAHCIASNTKAAKGVAPVSLMHKHGMSVGFGTDGPASGNTLDLFIQMRMCENFHKNELRDRSAFPAKEVVSMATIEGARALGLGDITGSIEPGKQADLVLVETDSPNMFPVYDPYSALVYSAIASNVRDVYVAGECLVKEKKLVREDFAKIRNDLREKMERTAFKDMKNLV